MKNFEDNLIKLEENPFNKDFINICSQQIIKELLKKNYFLNYDYNLKINKNEQLILCFEGIDVGIKEEIVKINFLVNNINNDFLYKEENNIKNISNNNEENKLYENNFSHFYFQQDNLYKIYNFFYNKLNSSTKAIYDCCALILLLEYNKYHNFSQKIILMKKNKENLDFFIELETEKIKFSFNKKKIK